MLETVERPPRPSHGGGVLVVEYTDPYSIWCWGCEPGIRRLEYVYGSSVEVRRVMGGLFEDFTPMKEYWSRMSGGRWKEAVHTFLSAVAGQHGMPINVDGLMGTMDAFRSTWPSCIAASAGFLQGPVAGRAYLRRLREAALLEGRDIGATGVQLQVAAESEIDAREVGRALEDGSALTAFRKDLTECRLQGVSGFPCFDLRGGQASLRLEGYKSWEALEEAVRELDANLTPRAVEPSAANVVDVLRHFRRAAAREVAAVLGITDDDAEILLEGLEEKRRVRPVAFGPAVVWEPAAP